MKFNKSLVYFLIFTIVGAVLTAQIVAKAYGDSYDETVYEAKIIKSQ